MSGNQYAEIQGWDPVSSRSKKETSMIVDL